MSNDPNRPIIELHPAYTWDCDACGRENFTRGAVAEMSEEDMAEMREGFGIDADETGTWMVTPDEVCCIYCGAKFTAVYSPLNDEDDLDV